MRALLAFAGLAALLAACEGPRTADNAVANQPEALEVANLADALASNVATENVSLPDTGPPKSCEAEIGKEAAVELAKRCRFVSPATRPPCHPANPCELIQSEIDRSCEMFGDDKPAECGTKQE